MKATGLNKPNQLERIAALEKNAETLSMGVRVSQMLIKQITEQFQHVQQQLYIKTSAVNDLQYRLLALQAVTGVDLNKVQSEADRLKIEEWNKASNEDSLAKGLVAVSEVLDEESIVVFTSSTPELPEDRGVFRSKVRLIELGSKEATTTFKGKKVNDQFEVVLADQKHLVTLLEVYSAPELQEVAS